MFASAASAQDGENASSEKVAKEKKVCKTVDGGTTSRMRKRICRTVKEWDVTREEGANASDLQRMGAK